MCIRDRFKSSANLPYERITRLRQLFDSPKPFTLDDHRRMQLDARHLRAESEIALFRGWTSSTAAVERARQLLASWNATLARDSAAAAIHDVWRGMSSAAERDPSRSADARKAEHEATLAKAVAEMTSSQGADWSQSRWGRLHTRPFPFPLVPAYSLATVERPGGTGTLAADGELIGPDENVVDLLGEGEAENEPDGNGDDGVEEERPERDQGEEPDRFALRDRSSAREGAGRDRPR